MTTLASIGTQIRTARKAAGLTAIALANRCGISRNTVHNLESGLGNVELNTLLAICSALGLDIQFVSNRASIDANDNVVSTSPLSDSIKRHMERSMTVADGKSTKERQ